MTDHNSQSVAIIPRQPDEALVADGQVAARAGWNTIGEPETQNQLKQFYAEPGNDGICAQDFDVANLAREQIENVVNKFNQEAKKSAWEHLGFMHKTSKQKAVEVLQDHTNKDFNDLKALVDNLEGEWKEAHGPVYAAFKKVCSTLDDHKTILKIFPSQNNYASPLVGSVTILIKAAKAHNDISILLSTSVAEISDKVATCSNIISVIKTSRVRRKLAEIYAKMFSFYQSAIEWYLKSKFGRFFRSFNENLVKDFKETKIQLDDCIGELYREAAVANIAMVAMINNKVESLGAEVCRQRRNFEDMDASAGQRMQHMMQVNGAEFKRLRQAFESSEAAALIDAPGPRPGDEVRGPEVPTKETMALEPMSASGLNLTSFIIGEEGPAMFRKGSLWLAGTDTCCRLQAWMAPNAAQSRLLWISSPLETGEAISEARAAALATVAAAWQAKAPVISFFCMRAKLNQLRAGMSVEQLGLLSLVYSFIHQLLQFRGPRDSDTIKKEDLYSLDGKPGSWSISLSILEALLDQTPVVTFCVLDGLHTLEWGDGALWCKQLLRVLFQRQKKPDSFFHILFTTCGQCRLLPQHIQLQDRQMATRKARDLVRSGGKIQLDLS